jgi:hypothetical protein
VTKADDAWRDAFVLELRLRGVPGTVIGEALAEVDAHCADSGQTPAEAFGDPVRYAAQRAGDIAGPTALGRTTLRAWWIQTAAIVGAEGLWLGLTGLLDRGQAQIRLGDLLTVIVLPPVLAVIVALAFRPGMGRRLSVMVALAFAVAIGAAVGSPLLWPRVVVEAPALILILVGVVGLGAALWPILAERHRPDPITDPRPPR